MKLEENVGSVALGYYVQGTMTRIDGTKESIQGRVVGFNENGAPEVIRTDQGHLMQITPPPALRCDAFDMLVTLQGLLGRRPADAMADYLKAETDELCAELPETDELWTKIPDPSEEAENGA